MKKFYLSAFLVLLSLSVSAEWRKFSSFLDGEVIVYIDTASNVRNGDIVKLWQLFDKKGPDQKGFLSYRTLNEYDCKEQKTRVLQDEYYKFNMADGLPADKNLTSHEWQNVAPNTLPMMILKFHCKT